MNILIGLFLIGLGIITAKYNHAVGQNLGTPSFVRKWFGPGREYAFYLLLSFIMILIGFAVTFGLFGMITNMFMSPFKGLVR